jgi:hypothetical protein
MIRGSHAFLGRAICRRSLTDNLPRNAREYFHVRLARPEEVPGPARGGHLTAAPSMVAARVSRRSKPANGFTKADRPFVTCVTFGTKEADARRSESALR